MKTSKQQTQTKQDDRRTVREDQSQSSPSKRMQGWQPCGGGWRVVRKSLPN